MLLAAPAVLLAVIAMLHAAIAIRFADVAEVCAVAHLFDEYAATFDA
jgi:hypothetical protein